MNDPRGSACSTETLVDSPPTAPPPFHQDCFRLQSHGVHYDAAPGPQGRPAPVQHARVGSPTTDEHRIGWRQSAQRVRRTTVDYAQGGHTKPGSVTRDPVHPFGVPLNRNSPAPRVGAQPFHGHRPCSRSHVPQQRLGLGAERTDRGNPYLSFGELPVVVERLVRQPGGKRVPHRFR